MSAVEPLEDEGLPFTPAPLHLLTTPTIDRLRDEGTLWRVEITVDDDEVLF